MKNLLLKFMLLCSLASYAQQKIHFDYDVAGNQITREFCLTCLAKSNSKDISELKSSDLLKFFPEDNFSYYPNPVKEELFIKWDNSSIIKISNIKLFSSNGVLLKLFENQESLNSQNVLFRDYPSGLYLIILSYNNAEEKCIKIIKQ